MELVIQLEKGLVHKDLHHFVEVPRLVQQISPLSNPANEVFLEETHALRAAVAVEHCKQTDQFPFTTTHVFFNQQAVLHQWPKADVLADSSIEASHFEGKIAKLDLRVKGKRGKLALGNARENSLDGDYPALAYLTDDVLAVE